MSARLRALFFGPCNEMESQFHSAPTFSPARCPFHDGPATLDALLAELTPAEIDALDLALDLRSAIAVERDAGAAVQTALRLRHALDGTHYLAFYRVRQWLQRIIVAQVRAWRGAEWRTYALPLNSARREEIENACLAAWSTENPGLDVESAQVRFAFASTKPAQRDPLTVTFA